MKILLIEDDEVWVDILVKSLTTQHYIVEAAEDGEIGWECAQGKNYDLILMDVELPKLNGIALCQRLRSEGCSTPILLITAKDATTERIRGLDAGADDYLMKPLDLGELQARVRALLRRSDVPRLPVLQVGALQLDLNSCQVTYSGKLLGLTPKEYSLLELFLRNPLRVFSRATIIEHLWSFDDPPQEESVKAHIKGLRQKLKAVGAVDWIENVYGLGYRLNPGKPTISQMTLSQEIGKHSNSKIYTCVEQQFNQAMGNLWIQYQGLMAERFEVLQQTAVAIASGKLLRELRQSAEQAAHKLAGVLGMFELENGTLLAKNIEEILLGDEDLLPVQTSKLRSLIQELGNLLNLNREDFTIQSSISKNDSTLPAQQALQLLVVDDDPVFLAALRPMLEPWGMCLTQLDNPLFFWDMLPKVAPHLLILDIEMPQKSGIELCQDVRTHPDWQALPILFLTAHRERETIQQMFAAGADDYVTKPIVGSELLTRITNRLERIRLLQTFSSKDPLTGLTNQPQSSRNLEHLIHTAGDNHHPVCLVVFTVAELRQINIQYGHAVGNQVLQQWSCLFQNAFSGTEVLGYWGNGEFVAGMPGLTKAQANERLSEILLTLRQQVFSAPDGTRFQAICNSALAEYPTDGQTVQSLYQVASAILEQAKL